jgi:hypothetical protein
MSVPETAGHFLTFVLSKIPSFHYLGIVFSKNLGSPSFDFIGIKKDCPIP